MHKEYCILCGKEVHPDQKCTITVRGKSPGSEEKKEVCLECIRQLRLLNKELRDCIENDLTKICVRNEEVLNEIENHLTSFLNMPDTEVNEINIGFNAGAKTVARLVLNIIEKANNEQDR